MRSTRALGLAPAILAILVGGSPAFDAGAPESPQDRSYAEGTDALDARKWEKAAHAFDEAVKQGGARTDAALYWKAYAEQKLGHRAESAAAIGDLRKRFPQSRWLKDAAALELEGKRSPERAAAAEGESDEELKLIAIGSLAGSDPERAIPLLEKVLAGSGTPEMKERALFVLTQISAPRAREIVAEIARGRRVPELQEEAIRVLGTMGRGRGAGNGALLQEIFESARDADVKEAVLNAWMVSGEKAPVLAAARGEKQTEVRQRAVELLGVMNARAELWELYQAEPSKSVKESVLEALSVAGDAERLGEIAKSEKLRELKVAAIEKLGVVGRKTEPTLVAIYRTESDPELKEAALEGLFVEGASKALVDLARAEKDRKMKARIVEKLSVMHTKEATDYMLEILGK
jgi:hypothetical protein